LIGENHPMWLTLARLFDLELPPITKDEDYESDEDPGSLHQYLAVMAAHAADL
jgi:hypothetical protein